MSVTDAKLTTTTTSITTTTRAPCPDSNITSYVTSDDERALVEITPDVKTELPVGSYMIYRDGCPVTVNVINSG